MKNFKSGLYLLLLFSLALVVSCTDDEPAPGGGDDGEEEITRVALTFTPDNGEDAVTATWFDEDGEGTGAPTIDDIELEEGVTYTMTVTLTNTLGTEDEDITAEVQAEDNEHQLFYAFTEGFFSDPEGDGNIDNASDPLNYEDQDENGLPVGLTTTWTAGDHSETEGEFRLILKHQPDLKTADSDATVGGTDIDITFPLHVEEGGSHDDEEEINEIVLTFTPDNGEDAITATWLDEDGEGVGAPEIGEIELEEGVTYEMTITLTNTLGMEPEDITEEIETEDNEHQFFFAFTEGYFSDPEGDGNIDNGSDPLNYGDEDENGLPVGLTTTWTAGDHSESEGEFRIVLKHQPDMKTADSDASVGGTDLDIIFPLHIEEAGSHDDEEEINEITLTFTPTGGGDAIEVKWFDEDGEGVGAPEIDDINLDAETEYDMTITLRNTLGMEPEDITEEIEAEDNEHQFFFAFTADIFSNPEGDGNIDNGDDPLNYNDEDENGLPVGLSTKWTTGAATSSDGTFRIVLKHQPDMKTATSDSTVGGTDIDIEFNISIQ